MSVYVIAAQPAPMTVSVTATREDTVVSVVGELDLTVADRFRRRLADEVARAPAALIIDLTGVHFCCAVILGILVQITTAADTAGVAWVIAGDSRAVRRPITITGLDPLLRPVSSVAAARGRLGIPNVVAQPAVP